MFKIIVLVVLGGIIVSLSGCASAASRKSDPQAEAAADAAVTEMDGDVADGRTSSTSPQKERAAQVSRGGKEPAWVTAPDAVYPQRTFVAATGYGPDRDQAEKDSLAKLIAVFGQSIQAELKTIHNYSEAVSRNKVQVSENTSVQNAVKTASEMDALIGAEIREVWFDNKRTYYAVATLEKARAKTLYTDLINANQQIIDTLLAMSDTEKYSLDGYARYRLAATIADANYVYANVLTIVDRSSGSSIPRNLTRGDDYRLEAAAITRNIPIGILIDNDRSDRIKDAFAGAIAKEGFRTGGADSRYMLRVRVTFTPVELPNQPNKFTRYVVDANFTDTYEQSVLFPFNINGREGHLTLPEAENRAFAAAEKKIGDTYSGILADYLTQLAPAKK